MPVPALALAWPCPAVYESVKLPKVVKPPNVQRRNATVKYGTQAADAHTHTGTIRFSEFQRHTAPQSPADHAEQAKSPSPPKKKKKKPPSRSSLRDTAYSPRLPPQPLGLRSHATCMRHPIPTPPLKHLAARTPSPVIHPSSQPCFAFETTIMIRQPRAVRQPRARGRKRKKRKVDPHGPRRTDVHLDGWMDWRTEQAGWLAARLLRHAQNEHCLGR